MATKLEDRKKYSLMDFVKMVENKRGSGKSPTALVDVHIQYEVTAPLYAIHRMAGLAINLFQYLLKDGSVHGHEVTINKLEATIQSDLEDNPDWKI